MRKMGDDGALLATSLVMMFSLDDASVSEQGLILFFLSNSFLLVKLVSRQTQGIENSTGN